MRKITILQLVLLFGIFSSAIAQTTVWNPAANEGGSDNWNEEANWTNGVPLAGSGKAVFNVPDAAPALVTDAQESFQNVMGDNDDGGEVIVKSGGSITSGEIWSAVGYNANAKLTVETGGEVTFGQHMWVGFLDGSEGEVHLNGGTINVNAMVGLGWEGGIGRVFVNDGLLDLADINARELKSIGEGSVLDISGGGVVTINGKRTAQTFEGTDYPDQIALFADAERMTALGGNADLIWWYDEEADETFIVAPAVVESTFPLDADTDVSRDADIEIVFSKEMDASTAEANVTVSPAIENQAFVWSQTGDTLKITGDLADGTTYAVSVGTDAVDLFGYNLAFDESFSFTVEGDLAVTLDAEDVSNKLLIYPNPTQDYFTFGKVAQEVEVMDVSGKLLLRDQNVMNMDVSSLAMGQYFVKAVINGNQVTNRLIIK